jgi:hypothetical protein
MIVDLSRAFAAAMAATALFLTAAAWGRLAGIWRRAADSMSASERDENELSEADTEATVRLLRQTSDYCTQWRRSSERDTRGTSWSEPCDARAYGFGLNLDRY